MTYDPSTLFRTVAYITLACWWLFALLFLLRKKPPKSVAQKRNPKSLVGVALVGAGFGIIWSLRRPLYTPMFDLGPVIDWLVAVVAISLNIGSLWLIMSAVRTLGRQWSIAAQLVDDHQLVTGGAYAIVRHPIYAGIMGMMIATGLAFSIPVWTLVAILIAWYGTHLRIQIEESLLRGAFGDKYSEYSKHVPALIPGMKWFT
jgi:protein-S-isoprenylcysteine O-methyltransferase Ste14